jgi:transcriptional regulator with GAF, ATPase, and Fis domain
MEYNSILKQVEEQEREKRISGKMFRYSGLILAVDFFSQKLNSNQILDAAFDFVNELLTLERSYEFYASGSTYKLGRSKGAAVELAGVETTETLKNLAVLHGSILAGKDVILKYFSEELYNAYSPEIILPIIADTDLEGFILIPQRSQGTFDDDDFIICEVLMKLFNGSMENFRRYTELHDINVSLDEKIFNLFAINQSSKVLLSELDLDALYRLSIDVFSELTQSSATGFVLYDEKIEKYSLKSYRLIYDNKVLNMELEPNRSARVDPNRVILDLSKEQDRAYFDGLFSNGTTVIRDLSPQYLVLLNRDKESLGFVTLGASVTGAEYKHSVFELIESLASSTYISISNAKHFKLVKEQKIVIQNKLDRLISLNNLTKNINSSESIDTLLEITLRTLKVSFAAEKCLLALYDRENNRLLIEKSHGIGSAKSLALTGTTWSKLFKGRTVLAYNNEELNRFFGNGAADLSYGASSALIAPIYLDKTEIELLGAIIIFEFSNGLISDEENVLTMETIAGHIAPILHNLRIIEEQNALLVPNYAEFFKRDLKDEISQAEDFELELCVLKISDPGEFRFDRPDTAGLLKPHFPKIYPLSHNLIYILTNEKIDEAAIAGEIREITGNAGLTVKADVFGRDFSSYTDYISR